MVQAKPILLTLLLCISFLFCNAQNSLLGGFIEDSHFMSLGNDTTLCEDSDSLLIGEAAQPGVKYTWYINYHKTDDTLHSQIRVKPMVRTTYGLKKEGSILSSGSILVNYKAECPVPGIPDDFTPDDDGHNDKWLVTIKGATQLSCKINDIFGARVFRSEKGISNSLSWDGKTEDGDRCPNGNYFYTIIFTDAKGLQRILEGRIYLSGAFPRPHYGGRRPTRSASGTFHVYH